MLEVREYNIRSSILTNLHLGLAAGFDPSRLVCPNMAYLLTEQGTSNPGYWIASHFVLRGNLVTSSFT